MYGVDSALKKDTTGEKPGYPVFFRDRDADALPAVFTEYAAKVSKRIINLPSWSSLPNSKF